MSAALVAAATTAALVIAACGSSSPSQPSASRPGGHTYAQTVQDDVNFARCMRSHGVPSFPNPTSPYALKNWAISSAAQSPADQPAETDCQRLLPGGGLPNQSEAHSQAQTIAFLAFSRCMRSHGFPSFPDPTTSGELTPQMLANAGVNLHQPAVLRAGDACVSVTHGVITKAAVASFVAGQ